jgi:DNA-binding beta-propeller fold protein YncE
VGCRGSNEIGIVDLAQKKVTASFATHTRSVARVKFAFGGKYLLATDPGNGEFVIFDAASHQELKRLKMGTGCEAIFPEPDQRHVLIGVTNENNVAEVDLETMSIVRRLSTGEGPDGMAWIGR